MSTTTEHSPARPPFAVDSRVYWPSALLPAAVSIGRVLDPATPDVPAGPAGTVPVLCKGTVCHVDPALLHALPHPAAPAA